MKRALLFILGIAFAAGLSAQQFKWVDKDGRTQYGDTPPPGVKATRLKPPSAGSAPAPVTSAKKDEKPLTPEAAFQKRQKDARDAADKAAKERADAEARRSNCDSAQANLRQLQSGQRIATMNSAGERVFMDDSARAQQVERAQQAVAENCK
jgi:hypothetical protein